MRQVLVSLLAACAVMFSMMAASPASAATARPAVLRAPDCNSDHYLTSHRQPATGWTKAEWTDNDCQESMQVLTYCYDVEANVIYTKKSGLVTGERKWDKATCDSPDPAQAGYISFALPGGARSPWFRIWHS